MEDLQITFQTRLNYWVKVYNRETSTNTPRSLLYATESLWPTGHLDPRDTAWVT